jgi:hypothetical protein
LPEQYKVKDFGGDAIAEANLSAPLTEPGDTVMSAFTNVSLKNFPVRKYDRLEDFAKISPGVMSESMTSGQLGGVITDQNGAVIPGTQVTLTLENGGTMTTQSDSEGRWHFSNLSSGRIKINADAPGFQTTVGSVRYNSGRPVSFNMQLRVGSTTETVEVTSAAPVIDMSQAQVTNTFSPGTGGGFVAGSLLRKDRDKKKQEALPQNGASDNVLNLQKRVAGVLPVRVDVPRAGTSYRFARALVLDEETKVTFSYKTK